MKGLNELAIKHGIKESHYIRGDEYIFTIEQLESLINEVISQRLGEPVGFISKESIWRLEQGGNDSKGTVPIHKKGSRVSKYPLYALNIES